MSKQVLLKKTSPTFVTLSVWCERTRTKSGWLDYECLYIDAVSDVFGRGIADRLKYEGGEIQVFVDVALVPEEDEK